MQEFEWSIPECVIEGDTLISVKYRVKLTDGDLMVETEGYWKMLNPYTVDSETTEHLVAHWVDLDATQKTKHLIKSRLQEQLDALKSDKTTRPPWAVDTFKVTI
jgi:hypothetical protein